MTTKAADDYETIRRRMEELKAERDLALTGSSASVQTEEQKEPPSWGYGSADYSAMMLAGSYALKPEIGDLRKIYVPSDISAGSGNFHAKVVTQAWDGNQWVDSHLPSEKVIGRLSSLAHPNWPYAGTGFEWRKFVRS